MNSYTPDKIHNCVLLSHYGAGKTSLAEAMLLDAGNIKRLGNVKDGSSVSDYDPVEIERQMSVNLSLVPLEWGDCKVNIIDTPGYADFVGEVKSGLRVSDGGVLVVRASSGVEVGTERMWQCAEEEGIPLLIFVNKMDKDDADFFRVLGQIQQELGAKCLPVQLPVISQRKLQGIIDLVTMKGHFSSSNEEGEVPSDVREEAESLREKLVELAVESDDDLLSRYLEGEELNEEEVSRAIKKAVCAGTLVPVLAGSAFSDSGVGLLLDAICSYLPSAGEGGDIAAWGDDGSREELKAEQDGTLASIVFKTNADPYVGKLSYLRVYSGTLASNSQVWNANRKDTERIGQLFIARGKSQEPVPLLGAGDIGAVARLNISGTGDTLCAPDHHLMLDGIDFPSPNLNMAIQPKTKADLDKLGTILPRMCEEDPSIKVGRDPDTREMIISGVGENHLEVAREKMQRKFGLAVDLLTPKVPYKETIGAPCNAEYKHKKQSGGHGQYGHVLLKLEPLPRGTGFEFCNKIVGGTVPKNYIPAVEKGINEVKQEGVLTASPVVDVRVTLYDGSFHPVDSSEIAFKIAAAQALKQGLSQGQPVLLEPVMELTVTIPESFTGDVVGDLNTKRGRVLKMTPEAGKNVIQALVPYAEVLRYTIDLKSMTQGRGSFVMKSSHYDEAPAHITQKVVENRAKQEEK